MPAALFAWIDPDPPIPTRPTRTAGPDMPGHPYGRQVLAAELAALGRATPGQRNHALNRCAFKVYRYVAGGLLDEEVVTAAFTTGVQPNRERWTAALAIDLHPAEIGRTLASARAAGLAIPRTVPARPDSNSQENES